MSTGDPICPICGDYFRGGDHPKCQRLYQLREDAQVWIQPKPKRGVLWKSKCYLFGNLQDISAEEAVSWRAYFQEQVKEIGIVCLNPLDKVFRNFGKEGKDFQRRMFDLLDKGDVQTVHEEMRAVRRRDLAQIDFSNCLVGVLNTEAKTYGVIEELSLAERSQKPIYLVVKPTVRQVPLWIAGMLDPSCIYSNLDDVITDLKLIDSGTKQVSNDNWRIFEEEYL